MLQQKIIICRISNHRARSMKLMESKLHFNRGILINQLACFPNSKLSSRRQHFRRNWKLCRPMNDTEQNHGSCNRATKRNSVIFAAKWVTRGARRVSKNNPRALVHVTLFFRLWNYDLEYIHNFLSRDTENISQGPRLHKRPKEF